MNDLPDDSQIRELYASFGLAYYQSECLHRELCMAFAWSGLPSRNLITRPRVEEQLAQAYSLTLGTVVTKLNGILPDELYSELEIVVEKRNFLAHHFWFDRSHLMDSDEQLQQLIVELDGYTELFDQFYSKVFAWAEPRWQELGINDELTQDKLNLLQAGESEEPLPDKRSVKELNKKLNKRQCLIRVWELTVEEQQPLVFELADGSLWQLSDVGLGWTRFQKKDSGWVEHPKISPHLPANIFPRPKTTAPWDYEFTLANGAVLWIKPGHLAQTFLWGVRTH